MLTDAKCRAPPPTVDVVLGIYITLGVWYVYHFVVLVPGVVDKFPWLAWLEDYTPRQDISLPSPAARGWYYCLPACVCVCG